MLAGYPAAARPQPAGRRLRRRPGAGDRRDPAVRGGRHALGGATPRDPADALDGRRAAARRRHRRRAPGCSRTPSSLRIPRTWTCRCSASCTCRARSCSISASSRWWSAPPG
jgi:hypothetical protein